MSEGKWPASLTIAEIQTHLERCERVLANPSLLSALPDRGERIVKRHGLLMDEKTRRAAPAADCHEPPPLNSSSNADVEEIVAKYAGYRINVAQEVHRMNDGILSEREIEKLIQDVPQDFLLTSEETASMSNRLAAQQRANEVRLLQSHLLKASAVPQ